MEIIVAALAFLVLTAYYRDATQIAIGTTLLPTEVAIYGGSALMAALVAVGKRVVGTRKSTAPLDALAQLEAYAVAKRDTSILDLVADIRRTMLEEQIRENKPVPPPAS